MNIIDIATAVPSSIIVKFRNLSTSYALFKVGTLTSLAVGQHLTSK